jgi:hypothetical protein
MDSSAGHARINFNGVTAPVALGYEDAVPTLQSGRYQPVDCFTELVVPGYGVIACGDLKGQGERWVAPERILDGEEAVRIATWTMDLLRHGYSLGDENKGTGRWRTKRISRVASTLT